MTSKENLDPPGFVRVRGAREHNLKNVSLEIPRDALVVFTGISGSGNHRWPLAPCMPKRSAATWNPSPPTPDGCFTKCPFPR